MAAPGAAYFVTGLFKTGQVFQKTFFGSHRPPERLPVSQWDPKNVAFAEKVGGAFGKYLAVARSDQRVLNQQTAAQRQQQQFIQQALRNPPTAYGGVTVGGGGSWDYLTSPETYSERTFPFPTFSVPDWTSSPAWLIEDPPEWFSR